MIHGTYHFCSSFCFLFLQFTAVSFLVKWIQAIKVILILCSRLTSSKQKLCFQMSRGVSCRPIGDVTCPSDGGLFFEIFAQKNNNFPYATTDILFRRCMYYFCLIVLVLVLISISRDKCQDDYLSPAPE